MSEKKGRIPAFLFRAELSFARFR